MNRIFYRRSIRNAFWCGLFLGILNFGGQCVEGIPVVLIHRGDSYYLPDCIDQALEYNDDVVLIGDDSNNHFPDATHLSFVDYFEEAKAFEEIYQHKSTNHPRYEMFCFQRWFVLKAYMEKHGIHECFYCDSDFMLYCDVTKDSDVYRPFDVVFMILDDVCSGHCSFFNLQGITEMCNYINYFYENFDILSENYGHISDMYVLKAFQASNENKLLRVKDANAFVGHGVFDWNMGRPNPSSGCSMKGGRKDVQWIENRPYVYSKVRNALIRFKGLHFQGGRKKFMHDFRRCRLIDQETSSSDDGSKKHVSNGVSAVEVR